MRLLVGMLSALAIAGPCRAGEVEVVAAKAVNQGDGTWRFQVTLRHADEGWNHYADRWEVVTRDGQVLGTRVLYHPHVDEQPFTRSLSGVRISPEISQVVVRAHDKVHGIGPQEMLVDLPR